MNLLGGDWLFTRARLVPKSGGNSDEISDRGTQAALGSLAPLARSGGQVIAKG